MTRSICSGVNTSGRVSTVSPTQRCSEASLSLWASSSVGESRPFRASKHLRTNHSWYSGSLLVKVPPMTIRSILSVLCPISVSCVTLSLTCIHGSKAFLPALRAAGSFPVYDWGELFPTPPGQNAQRPWGQSWGDVITATTATPLMVRVGFFRRNGVRSFLSSGSTFARTSEFGGTSPKPYFLHSFSLRF